MPFLISVVRFLGSLFKSRRELLLENLALRQQVTMLRQSVKRPRATVADKVFWILFSRYVDGWRKILYSLHPDTVVRWHRQGFRYYWRCKSRGRKPGRPAIDADLRKLIREMQTTNVGWGASGCGPPESTGSCSNWVSKYHRRQFQNTCGTRINRLHKLGELFSVIIQSVWQR